MLQAQKLDTREKKDNKWGKRLFEWRPITNDNNYNRKRPNKKMETPDLFAGMTWNKIAHPTPSWKEFGKAFCQALSTKWPIIVVIIIIIIIIKSHRD